MPGKLLKDQAYISDHVQVLGRGPKPRFRGMRMPDGSPVTAEFIMQTYGVDLAEAERIAKRQTR